MEAELQRQPARQREDERDEDDESPGVSADRESKGRDECSADRDASHCAQAFPVLASGVAERDEQDAENRAEHVHLVAQSRQCNERHGQDRERLDTPGHVQTGSVESEHAG
jgi:hypothetical protein